MAFANIGSEEDIDSTATDVVTISITVPSLGTNRVGIVLVNIPNAGAAGLLVNSVTWNGVSMTENVEVNGGTAYTCAIYSLVGCAHNGTYNVVISLSNNVIHNLHITTVWADATNGISLDDTSSTSGTTQNPTITSTQAGSNEFVVSLAASAANALGSPVVSGCTELQSHDFGGDCASSAYSTPASSGDTTHTHNFSQSGSYAIASASFKETATAASSLVTPRNLRKFAGLLVR